jgi:hypothetical protein
MSNKNIIVKKKRSKTKQLSNINKFQRGGSNITAPANQRGVASDTAQASSGATAAPASPAASATPAAQGTQKVYKEELRDGKLAISNNIDDTFLPDRELKTFDADGKYNENLAEELRTHFKKIKDTFSHDEIDNTIFVKVFKYFMNGLVVKTFEHIGVDFFNGDDGNNYVENINEIIQKEQNNKVIIFKNKLFLYNIDENIDLFISTANPNPTNPNPTNPTKPFSNIGNEISNNFKKFVTEMLKFFKADTQNTNTNTNLYKVFGVNHDESN